MSSEAACKASCQAKQSIYEYKGNNAPTKVAFSEQGVKSIQAGNNLGFLFEYNTAFLAIMYNSETHQLQMVQDSQEFAQQVSSFPNVLRTIIQDYYQVFICNNVIKCAWSANLPSFHQIKETTLAWDQLLYQYGATTSDLQEWFYFLLSTLIVSEGDVFPVICSQQAENFPLFRMFCELFPSGTYIGEFRFINMQHMLDTMQQRFHAFGVSFWSLSKRHKLRSDLFNEMVSQSIYMLTGENPMPLIVKWKIGGIGLVRNKNDLFSSIDSNATCHRKMFGIEFIKKRIKYDAKELHSNLPAVLIKVLAVREKWNTELLEILKTDSGLNKPLALRQLLAQKFLHLMDRKALPSCIVKCSQNKPTKSAVCLNRFSVCCSARR